MFDTRERKERSVGTRLSLKAFRSYSPKSAMTRRPSRPGMHGKRRRGLSEFGEQLQEKQRIKYSYGIRESQLKRVFQAASKKKGVTGDMILQILERRLDNVVYRLGLAKTRSQARQMVGHGHILVNGRKVDIASYQVRPGSTIGVHQLSVKSPYFNELSKIWGKQIMPNWLAIDSEAMKGQVLALPTPADAKQNIDLRMIVEFYSR